MKRILALLTDAYGSRGGIARYNRELLGALSGPDTAIDVLVRTGRPSGPVPQGIRVLSPAANKAAYALRALSMAAFGRYDTVLCGHLYMAGLGLAAARAAKARLWLQLHGLEAWERPSALLRAGAENARLITSVSRYTRARFLSWAKADPLTVKVLPNTVDPAFSPGLPDPRFIEKWGLAGKKVLLTVARMSKIEPGKGIDRAIEALSRIAPRRPDLAYVVAGEGDDMPRLKALAERLGLGDRVIFAGFVPESDLPGLFRSADAFVMPSIQEGFGIVFLEAMGCGLPVLAGNRDGSMDPLRDGAMGIGVDPDDPEAVARGMLRVLEAPKRVPEGLSDFDRAHFSDHVRRLKELL